MQMLILSILTFILGGALALLGSTLMHNSARIAQALSGRGVLARNGKRKKHQHRVNFVNFDQRRTAAIGPELTQKQRTVAIRLIVDNDGCRGASTGPTARQPLAA